MRQNAMFSAGILGPVAALLVAATPGDATLRRWEFTEPHLGTQVRLVIYAAAEPKDLARTAFARIQELNRIFSDYDDASELLRLCRGPVGVPQPLSTELADALNQAQTLAHETAGAFDVTVGPYSVLWRRARRQQRLPTADALCQAGRSVGFQHLRIDSDKQTATLAVAGMRLDLGGLAKGLIAEQAYHSIAPSAPRAMVAIGGDIYAGDAPPGAAGWQVQVGPPPEPPAEAASVTLVRQAISTSGDLEQFFDHDGKRYSHILDPRTGWGVEGSRLVTVIAPHGLQADAFATALSVLSVGAGQAWIEKKPGAAARWVVPQPSGPPEVVTSTRWPGPAASERPGSGKNP